MKNLLFVLFSCCATIGFAQEKSLLYSVKKEGSETSYLYGTTHLIADSAYYFSTKLEKTLARTDVLVLEINNLLDQQKAADLLLLDSGSLFDIFTSAQADSVINWGSNLLHMKPEAFRKGFEKKKPLVLLQISLQAAIEGRARSYELELMGKALNNKQSIEGLETMEYQVSLFDQLPDTVIREMILEQIRHPEEGKAEQQKLTQLYIDRDVEGLAELIEGSGEMEGSVETLLYQRNRNWIPVMIRLMETRTCFFAVGAGHLGGENGVIQLLKNAGYHVTPLSY